MSRYKETSNSTEIRSVLCLLEFNGQPVSWLHGWLTFWSDRPSVDRLVNWSVGQSVSSYQTILLNKQF